ncbi:MAG: hypothetical protein AAF481_16015 [Acidobacteriota bacterium]
MKPAVLVGFFQHATPSFLHRSYRDLDDSAPGLLLAEDAEDLRQQILIRSAALCLSGFNEPSDAAIYGTLPFGRGREEEQVLGGNAEPAEVRTLLGGGVNVLTVVAHGDGVDASLGEKNTLCPYPQRLRELGDREERNGCQIENYCHRLELPYDEAIGGEALLSPGDISAKVLLWASCLGFLPAGTVVGAAHGLGRRFLQSDRIGAVVTAWRVQTVDPVWLESLARRINSGVPVGQALAQALRARPDLSVNGGYCLLGDPALRTGRPGGPSGAEIFGSRPKIRGAIAAGTGKDPKPDGTPFLILWSQGDLEQADTAVRSRLLYEIGEYRRARQDGGDPERGGDAPGPRLRQAAIDLWFGRGHPLASAYWQEFAATVPLGNFRTCPSCRLPDNRVFAARARFSGRGIADRLVLNCAVCGIVTDVPGGFALALHRTETGLRWVGTRPARCWSAGVILKAQRVDRRRALPWPADSAGQPDRELNLVRVGMRGIVDVGVCMMVESEALFASTVVRITPPDL